MFQKIQSYLSQGNRTQWCVFIVLALIIFIKCVLFRINKFQSTTTHEHRSGNRVLTEWYANRQGT